nr:immunoglobulin heavy chain junction region [Mus musculus]
CASPFYYSKIWFAYW